MPRLELDTSAGRVAAFRADPPGAPRGAVVVLQEIFGLNAHIRDVTGRVAEAGYVAFAPALFDPVERDVELDYDAAGITRGRELVAQLGIDRALAVTRAAFDAVRVVGTVGVVGFCWGGTVAFLANTRLGLPSVSYYGARTVPYLHEVPRGPQLFHFGGRDTSIPESAIQAHRDALSEAEIHVYAAGHGFNCDIRADYDADAAMLAWQRSLGFFAQVLG